nr:MAG TPA_asm: hypothetical protein [Caudoviricetes sp.]
MLSKTASRLNCRAAASYASWTFSANWRSSTTHSPCAKPT